MLKIETRDVQGESILYIARWNDTLIGALAVAFECFACYRKNKNYDGVLFHVDTSDNWFTLILPYIMISIPKK